MLEKIKEKLKNNKIEERREMVPAIRLRDLILLSDKNSVLDFAVEYISKKSRYELISVLIGLEGDYPLEYVCPINNRSYLSKKFDSMYCITNKKTSDIDKETLDYVIAAGKGFILPKFPTCLWGYDEFIGVIHIDTNCESTDRFIKDPYNKNAFSIEFMLNCRIEKVYLDIPINNFVALALLQIIYIEELNKGLEKNVYEIQ